MTQLLPDTDDDFATQITSIRKHLKLTYLGFAKKCNISQFTVQKIEKAYMPRLKPATWNKINKFLTSVGYFQQTKGDNSEIV